jgi:hypothetical protein
MKRVFCKIWALNIGFDEDNMNVMDGIHNIKVKVQFVTVVMSAI